MSREEGGYYNPALEPDFVELKVEPGVPIGYSNYNNYHPKPSPGYSYAHSSSSGYRTPTQSNSSYTGTQGTHSSTRSKRRRRKVVQKKPEKPHDWLFFSVFTCIACCIVPGFAAVVASCLSKESWRKEDEAKARKYGKYALILWIVAAACGACWIIFVIVYFAS